MYLPAITLLAMTFSTASATALQGRGVPGGVYLCTGIGFTGNCAWHPPSDKCYISGTGSNRPVSLGPDEGTVCTLYKDSTCGAETKMYELGFPGLPWIVERLGSLKCVPGDRPATP